MNLEWASDDVLSFKFAFTVTDTARGLSGLDLCVGHVLIYLEN